MKSKNLIEESIKLQLEAKAIGLDWIELDKIIDKIREETDELDEAIESKDREHIIEEFEFKEVLLDIMLNFLLFAGALSCKIAIETKANIFRMIFDR